MRSCSPPSLPILDAEIENRVQSVRTERPDWPCQAGCSECCRTLAGPIQATRAEWERLWAAISTLPDATTVRARLTRGPRLCPLLDTETHRCRVYAARPLACRAYGFYMAKDGRGRWCTTIDARPDLDDIVFGHEGGLDAAGPVLTFAQWSASVDHP